MEQPVNLEQAFARHADAIAAVREKTPLLERRERCGELDARVGAELPRVMRRIHAAELQAQHEFADVKFLGRWRERAKDGQLAGVHGVHVGLELVVILVMHAAEMSEARHADGQMSAPENKPSR